MQKIKKLFCAFAFFVLGTFAFSKTTPIKNLYQWTLPNGLKLFVCENHAVPLTYIEIAVKCGAYTQEKETAGLFHLYEHMMFKGNSLYKDAASVKKALSDMGVANWNGTTDVECVNYFFTVPSDITEDGLAFWNAAIRNPLLDEKELENEKKVVISEIQGNLSETGSLYHFSMFKNLFGDEPWKLDSGGSIESISNCDVQTLKKIQKTFYVPNNAALFVGGDVDPKKVYKTVLKIFGSWKKEADPFENGVFHHDADPIKTPVKFVLPYDQISKDWAQVLVTYRGPDLAFDREDSYSLDGLGSLCKNPRAKYVSNILEDKVLNVPDIDYIGVSYPSERSCGRMSFNLLLTSPENNITGRADYFVEKLPEWVMDCAKNSKIEKSITIQQLSDSRAYETETAEGLLSTLRSTWIFADENYYYDYITKMGEVSNSKLVRFVQKYLNGKNPFIVILINPELYEMAKDEFDKGGWIEITKENAIWFLDEKYGMKAVKDSENGSSEEVSETSDAKAEAEK